MTSLHEAWDTLDAHLASIHDVEAAEQSGMYKITDLDTAEWAVRKIARARRQLAMHEEMVKAQKQRLDDYLAERRHEVEQSTRFFLSLLEGFQRRLLEDDPNAKTIKLPSGELRAWKQRDRWEFSEDFTAWAEANAPDLVRVKVEVQRDVAKRRLAERDGKVYDPSTGALVPGVEFEPGEVAYTVRTEEG